MSRIYDSSAITQRRRDQAQAGSFINRIQNPNNPQTSYGPLQGNYDASIMNSVKMGQPKEFYRNSGCIIISNGCPCPPIAVDEIVSGPTPPVILAPGSVSNILVEYGSVIVTWNAPITGGTVASYTLFADDQTNSANSVTITGITTPSYSFATLDLRSGDEYQMSVIGVNAAGNGSPPTSLPLPISAPYIAPISTTTSSEFFPNRIVITLTPYTVFTPTKYILKTYINDAFSSTSSSTDYSPNLIIVNTNLSCLNVYSFQVQLLNNTLLNNTQYSSFGIKGTNVPVYPYGPNFLPPPNDVTNITTTTAQVNYADYTIEGFDLTTGNAECILNSVPAIGYTQLTNTSVTLNGLTEGTNYPLRSITISFRKTIQGNVITSPPLSLPSFMTNNIIPGSVSNVLAIYGTTVTNVTWDAPTTGGTVASYTLFADDQTNSANSVTITGITDISYIFNTGSLTAGDEYLFRVTAVNSAGSGTAGVSSSFYAPYIVASDVSAQALITNPNTIFINFSPYEFGIGLPPKQYTLIQYTNGTYTTTTTSAYGTNQIAISSGLNATDLYSFQFQLSRPANNKYTSYTPLTTPTRIYPAGPTIIGYSDYSTTSVKIKYENFLTDGYDLTGATCTITNVTTTLTIQAGSLTNRSVIVEGLSPATPYANYTISFSKSPYYNSAASSLTFYTYGEALSNISYSSDGTNPTTTHIQCIYSNYTATGGFSLDPPASIVATDGSTALNYANITNTTFTFTDLTPGRIYNNVQITLYNSPYRSVTFTLTPFTTSSEAPTGFIHGNLADIPVTFTFNQYTPFTSGITAITFYATKNNTDSVTISGTVVSDQSMTISLDPDASYTYAYIIIYNGLITSLPSNEITFRTPYPNPTITVASPTCRTQELEFSYSTTYFTPTGVAIVAPSGVTVSALSASNPYYVTLENLTPDTTYSTIKIQLTGNSGESSQYTTISPFTTLSVTTGGNINNLNVGIVTTNSIQMTFDSFGGFGTSGGNPTGAIVTTSNGVVILPQNIELDTTYTSITITGLAQGLELSNPTITLTNDANCLQSSPSTYGGTIRTYYAAPTGLVVSYITQTTATIDFTFSSFQPSTNNTYVTRAGFSNLTVLTVTESFVTITGLTTGTSYSDYQLQLGTSIGQTTEPTTIPPFTQWPAPDVNAAGIYTGTDYVRIPYSQYTAFYPSGGILYTNNGSFSSVFSITDYYIEINGLSSGAQYDNCYITLTDGSNTSYPSYPTYPYFSFTTQNPPPSYPAPDVNTAGISTGTDYVTIPYSTYTAFSPSNVSSGTLYTNNGSFSNVSSISNTEMTVSGLSPGQYDNCYITLTDNTNTSDPSHPTYPYFSFTIQSSPPSYPAPDVNAAGIYTGTDYVRIPYSQYTTFYPSGGTLYTNNGSFSSVSSITDYHIEINGLSSGTQYDNCYITLTDNSNTSDPSYPTYQYFSFTTQNPSPSYPAPDVNASAISTGTDYVTIPYSQYNALYPSGGTLYVNGTHTGNVSSIYNTQMTVSMLSSGTLYDSCYITLTDGSNTSDPSTYFSFTTVPNAPSAIQVQPYAYYTQDIIFDSYTAPLTGAIISDGGSSVYGYTNLTQSSLTITGLRPGYGYSLSVQVVNAGGTSSSSSISYFTTNYPPPNPNVTTIVGDFDSNAGTATISVFFDSYLSEFIPISGTLYDSNTMPLGSFNSVSSTSLVVTGVSTDNYYANCYITLYNGTDTTPQSNPFNVGTTPVTGAGQIITTIDPYANPIRIGYNNVGSSFNPFNASTGTIYVPNYGNWSGTAVSQQGGDNFADFTLPITGTYDNCYIVLFDTTGKSTLSSNTFTIAVT